MYALVSYSLSFLVFIPRIIYHYFTTLNQKMSSLLPEVFMSQSNILQSPTCFYSRGTFFRESNRSNAAQNQISHKCGYPVHYRIKLNLQFYRIHFFVTTTFDFFSTFHTVVLMITIR